MSSRCASAALLSLCVLSCARVDWKADRPPAAALKGLASPELVAFMPEDDLWPRVSADGRYVVFVSQQNGNMDVWVRDHARRSTYPITLDAVDDFDPDVSPVAEKLVFVSRRSDAKGDLYLAESFDTGASAERLTYEGSHDRQPTFSADGRRLYFTQAYGVGDEFIAELDLTTRRTRRISPGPGFDPAASPDGRHIVYTAPGLGPQAHPHVVALRLTDGATRAVTLGQTPAGFARFDPAIKSGLQRLVLTRFADDDDGSGRHDAEDQASLWRIDVDFEALFEGQPAVSRPFPLTDGASDEMFADVQGGYIYFTQGLHQQDILRLPLSGIFPDYPKAESYFALAETIQDPRTRWFVLRCALAKAEPHSLIEAQALLRIARLQQERARPDLAGPIYAQLLRSTVGAAQGSGRAQLRGLAELALVGIERRQANARASGVRAQQAVVRAAFVRVADVERRYPDSGAVAASATLERAEILVDSGRRVEAAELLELLVRRYPSQTDAAARALLRRVDLLGVAYAPEAIAEAYRQVLERFPNAQAVVRRAAQSIVQVHLGRLETQGDPQREVDALRRLVERYGAGPVRTAARWQLVERMQTQGQLELAAGELARLIAEAGDDRLAAALALRRRAQLEERRGRGDLAVQAWRRLSADFNDLPGFGTQARASITRVSLARAQAQERAGQFQAAAQAYKKVILHDVDQVQAHRRYLALTARIGGLEQALEEAERRAKTSPRTPVARYALGLARTWQDPPQLDAALEEIEQALSLNPQLVHAYVTRGWIREMQELEDPGVLSRAKDALVEGVGRALGGLLDVEIGKQGRLELALEDYKTALRLNLEAQDPSTEAEILLNLGNAHYRLAEQTNDLGNMRAAFERYLDALRIDLEHKDPRAELIFWERLGRAAAWVDEHAVGVMATRRALQVSQRTGLKRRDGQLVGNLALLYSQAHEEAYAREALKRFESYQAETEGQSGWVVAVRDRARARLQTVSARDQAQLDGVLASLASGRAALDGLKEVDRGPLPSLWLPLGPDASRAQYGFDRLTEMDVNLALAESAHRGLADVGRANALRGLRAALTRRIIDEVPSLALGFGDQHPTPLGVLREHQGLMLVSARQAHLAGELDVARLLLQAVQQELDSWLGSDRYANDHAGLRVDRARLWALRAELWSQAPTAEASVRAELMATLPSAQEDLQSALTGSETATVAEADDLQPLPALPLTLNSSSAYAQTASAAASRPPFAGVALDARVTQARLSYAQGLMALRDAEHPEQAPDLRALWRGLDGRLAAQARARRHFEAAALAGARAGVGRGARIAIMAMAARARLHWAEGASSALCEAAVQAAARLAERTAQPSLAWRARLLGVEVGPPEALAPLTAQLSEALPAEVDSPDLVQDVLTRSASIALSKGHVGLALGALDQALLYSLASGPVVEFGTGRERQDIQGMVRARAAAQASRRALSRVDARTSRERFQQLMSGAVQDLAEARRVVSQARLTDLGQLRLLARARDPVELEYDVEAGEALLVPTPLAGQLHLILVDGSTVAEDRLLHITPEVPVARVVRDLQDAWTAAQAGEAPSAERRARLRRALIDPVRPYLEGKRKLYVAPGLLGGPLPATLTKGQEPVLVHLSAPSALAASRAAQLVGVQGELVVRGAQGTALTTEGQTLGPADMMPFRAGRSAAVLEAGEARRLSERPAVEALADRAQDLLVVDAPLHIEAAAPERSALQLGASDPTLAPQDAFATELPLGALDLPARLLVLTGVEGGRQDWLHMDAALVQLGFSSSVLVPLSAPKPAVQRLVRQLLDTRQALGPALALRQAIEAEVGTAPQLAFATLVGSAGLDREETKSYAASQVRAARTRAVTLLNRGEFEAAVPAFERWIRLQIEAGETKYVASAYRALVAIVERRLTPPDYARAADVQGAFVEFLKSSPAQKKYLQDARIDLGFLYSQAHDYAQAEAYFEQLLRELEASAKPSKVARAYYKYGLHHREALQYQDAAKALEKAIELWQDSGVYEAKKVPSDAMRALREVGEVYLNRLSDPVAARRAYLRARKYARRAQDSVGIILDLARVARRRGDFGSASELAGQAQREAKAAGLQDLALSALIEATNVSWYQGDYRRAERLCTESLKTADRLIAGLRKKKGERDAGGERLLRRRKIHALSVCGLTAMSQRDRGAALGHLQLALRIARSLRDLREAATQHNNLGRVHLEFGAFETAAGAFGRARAIDERLQDKYSLAYDLRNLGWTLLQQGRYEASQTALRTALVYSQQARDTNNELRARFALAELARVEQRWPDAVRQWQAALPLAQRLDVKDLAWQIHRHLGLHALRGGDERGAEAAFRKAVAIARTITGRAAPSALSPPRYAAFDDLAGLLLKTGRAFEAFEVVEQARLLEQLELLDDARLYRDRPEVPGIVQRLKESTSSSVAASLSEQLRGLDPRVAALMRTESAHSLRGRLGAGSALLVYRVIEDGVLAFWLDANGLRVALPRLPRAALLELVRGYAQRLSARADLEEVSQRLSKLLLQPFTEQLKGVQRLGLVLHGPLRNLSFAALPLDERVLLQQAVLIRALHPAAAADALARPLGALAGQDIVAMAGAAEQDRPLPFADRELTVIQEEHPQAQLLRGQAAGRGALLKALQSGQGTLHFAGHTRLSSRDASTSDPLGGSLLTRDGEVSLLDVLTRRSQRDLVVLSSCETQLARPSAGAPDGAGLLSLAQTFHLAGAGHVLATTLRVDDVAAALVMKRFYRAARRLSVPEALRQAQLQVRKSHPHPAWWAGFVLSAGG